MSVRNFRSLKWKARSRRSKGPWALSDLAVSVDGVSDG